MKKGTIGFIGLGNMAKAMIGGMLEKGIVRPEELIGADKSEFAVKEAAERFHIQTTKDNKEVAQEAEILFLAVKPQFMAEAVAEIKDCITDDILIVSIAAGKTIGNLTELFGKEIRLSVARLIRPRWYWQAVQGYAETKRYRTTRWDG